MSNRKHSTRTNPDDRDSRVETGVGNIFEDIGLLDPEMRLAKSSLAQHIARLIVRLDHDVIIRIRQPQDHRHPSVRVLVEA